MSNGYLLAAGADVAAAEEIAGGFGLDVIDAASVSDAASVAQALAQASNVGLLLSTGAAGDAHYRALLEAIAQTVARAQLILVDADARAAFAFLPEAWPGMSLEDARARSSALARQSETAAPPQPAPEPEPAPPAAAVEPEAPPAQETAPEPEIAPDITEPPPVVEEAAPEDAAAPEPDEPAARPEPEPPTEAGAGEASLDSFSSDDEALADGTPADEEVARTIETEAPQPQASESQAPEPEAPAAPPAASAEPPPAPAMEPPPAAESEPPQAPGGSTGNAATQSLDDMLNEEHAPPARKRAEPPPSAPMPAPPASVAAPESTAPADATAFAPKKLRRGTPELVRIVVHQPKDLNEVIKAAKKLDPRTDPAPSGMPIGAVKLGASIGVSLEVRGGQCDGALQRRVWRGEPIDFSYAVEADDDVKQVVILARVFIDDAQIGVLAFTRKASGPAKKPHGAGDRVRLKRHKRVFLSYSSKDRETVAQIATAYQMAGVEHFWDRASLKSGEEWHPRLRREIDRADLFHLCWSRAASESEWVQKETEHALTRRKRQRGKPDITVQMLDGPPWAPHPPEFDAINFDDFVRAAIVGYARGDGSS